MNDWDWTFWIRLFCSANNESTCIHFKDTESVHMLEELKKLFVYKKPSEHGFRFPEDPPESELWDVYRGKTSNLENNSGTGNNQNNQKENQSRKNERDSDVKNKEDKNNKESKEKTKRHNKRNKEEQIRIISPMPINELVKKNDNKENNKNNQENENTNKESEQKCECNSQVREPELDKNKTDTKTDTKEGNDKKENEQEGVSNNREYTEESSKNITESKENDNGKDPDEEEMKDNKENDDKSDKNKAGSNESDKNEDTQQKDERNKQENQSDSDGNKENKDSEGGKKEEDNNQNNTNDQLEINISCSIEENISILRDIFNMPVNQDVIIREFKIARKIKACVVFIDGMIDKNIIIQFTLPQLMDPCALEGFESGCPLDFLEKNVLPIHQVVRMDNYKYIVPQILSGLTVIFIDGCDECLVMESRGFEKRDISVPSTETVVSGSQEAFTENLRTNITLVRRIVKNESLVTEFKIISKTNNILAALLYIEDIVNKKLVEEVKRRVNNLNVDYIAGSGMLEQLIEDKSLLLFPQIISTERPDRVASFLMDGKVVLICEGTPFALAMPITFFDLFHTSEDSNLRWQYGTFLRIVRLIGTLLAFLLPGLWTALILFHQEMIPTSLLSSIVISRAPVPFPFIIEFLLMEISFELIREGGIRVPGITGNTLGIIGALILGQSAVSAGLVSPSLIIIVAVTGLGSFTIPNYSLALAVRIARFVLIGFGAVGGLYGISIGFTIFLSLALGMKSFGVPFFAPVAPMTRSNQDKIVRGPLYKQEERPDYLNTQDEKRMGDRPRGWVRSSTAGGGRNNDK